MPIKLLIKNIKHHFILSLFLLLSLTSFMSMLFMQFEYENFIAKFNLQEYIYENNGFDITIKSKSIFGMSPIASNKYKSAYEKSAAFYQAALVVEGNGNSVVATIFEGKSQNNDEIYNYQNAFSHFDADLSKKEDSNITKEPNDDNVDTNKPIEKTIITKELATSLDVKIGDFLAIYLNKQMYTYQICNIVESEGFFSDHSMLIVGENLSKNLTFLPDFANLILIQAKDEKQLDDIYDKLIQDYDGYNVTNIKDEEYIKSFVTNDALVYIVMTACMLFGLFILIKAIYQKKVKKQKDIINNYSTSYYYRYQIMARAILFITSYLLGLVIVQGYFSLTASLYAHPFTYRINIRSCLFAFIIVLILYVLLSVPFQIKLPKMKKIYGFILLGLCILLGGIGAITHQKGMMSVGIVCTTFILIWFVIRFCFHRLKYLKNFLKRVYMYHLNKRSILDKVIIVMYIIIACFFSIILTSMVNYHQSIDQMDQLINLDTVVLTNGNSFSDEKIGMYDFIKIHDGKKDLTIDTVLGFDTHQVEKYTNVSLTDEEKKLFEKENAIILSKYFQNKLNCEVGDFIQVKLPGTLEEKEYQIVKFVDSVYWKFAFVNRNDTMMNGYIVKEDLSELKHNLTKTTYNVVDVNKQVNKIQSFYDTNLKQVSFVLIFIMAIFIFFLFYLSYIDLENKKESIKKLHTLGLSVHRMVHLNLFQMIFNVALAIVLSICLSSVVVLYFDSIASIFKTTFYIDFHAKLVILSSFIMSICLAFGTLYTTLLISKIGKENK